jgi:hypothetical protein
MAVIDLFLSPDVPLMHDVRVLRTLILGLILATLCYLWGSWGDAPVLAITALLARLVLWGILAYSVVIVFLAARLRWKRDYLSRLDDE